MYRSDGSDGRSEKDLLTLSVSTRRSKLLMAEKLMDIVFFLFTIMICSMRVLPLNFSAAKR